MPAAPPEPIDGRRTATEPTAGAPPTPPAATHRHRVPDAIPTSTRATTGPRRCRTNATRANAARANRPETHRDGAHTDDPARAAAHTARRHAPSPRPRRDPHVHPRHDRTTPASHGGAPRAPDEPPLHARPSDRRADAPMHSAAPVAAPFPTRVPALGRGARHARLLRPSTKSAILSGCWAPRRP